MTYEEYKTLIKAKFEEVQEKASFDIEGYKTITGFSQDVSYNGVTAHIVLTLCGEIQTILEQISGYANAMLDQIRDDVAKERQERTSKFWNNIKKEESKKKAESK